MRVNDSLKSGHPRTLLMSFDAGFLVGVLRVYVATDVRLTPAKKGFMVAVPILGSLFQFVSQRFRRDLGAAGGPCAFVLASVESGA